MKGDKHNHHYIPNFILRRFQFNEDPKKSKAHLIELDTGEVSKVVRTKKMYMEKDLYKSPIEDAIDRNYEMPVSDVLKRLEKADSVLDITINELLILRKYLLLQLVRIKAEKESYSDIPDVWEQMINKCVSKESLQSMIKTSTPYISKLSEFFLYGPILFVKAKREFIMPDGALMDSYISYPEWINPDMIYDENRRPRIENGVHPNCPPGKMVNFMFYPMGPEFGILLMNPLWTNQEFIKIIGATTLEINPLKILDNLFRNIPTDKAGRRYSCSIVQLDEKETSRLVKELIFASERSLIARDLRQLQIALSELIIEKPNYQNKEQVKTLIKKFKALD